MNQNDNTGETQGNSPNSVTHDFNLSTMGTTFIGISGLSGYSIALTLKHYLKVFYYWSTFPAFIYHELSHIIILLITHRWVVVSIPKSRFIFKVNADKPPSYELSISLSSHYAIAFLIVIAPAVTFIIGYVYCIFNHAFLAIYFGYAFNMFFLSEGDISGLRKCNEILINKWHK